MLNLVQNIENFLLDRKMSDISVIDTQKRSPIVDFIIIGTGTSRRAINSTLLALKTELKHKKIGKVVVEIAQEESEWAVMMCSGIIIHLFNNEQTRNYYDIEGAWN